MSDAKEMAFCGKHSKIFNETPAQAWHRAHVDPKDGDSGGHCIRCDLEKAGDYLQGFHNGLTTAPAADTDTLRAELASQAAKIEAVRSMTKAISAFARHSPNCEFNLTFGEKACDCGLTDLRVRLAALES